MPLTLALRCTLSDVIHGDDDTIDSTISIFTAEGGQLPLIEATVTSQFWANGRVRDHDALRVVAPIADIDALVIALFQVLAAKIREFGTDHLNACYPDFRSFLADHLPPAVAARLDAAFCHALPQRADDGTISFSIR